MLPPAMPALSSTWRCSISPAGSASTRTRRRFRFLRLRPGKRITECRDSTCLDDPACREPSTRSRSACAERNWQPRRPHLSSRRDRHQPGIGRLAIERWCRRARSRNPRRAKTQVLMLSSDMAAPEVSAMERRGCARSPWRRTSARGRGGADIQGLGEKVDAATSNMSMISQRSGGSGSRIRRNFGCARTQDRRHGVSCECV